MFTFDKEEGKYSASLEYDSPSLFECKIVLNFKDGKLSEWVTEYEENGIDYIATIEYTYGMTVTIPQNILDMEVTED